MSDAPSWPGIAAELPPSAVRNISPSHVGAPTLWYDPQTGGPNLMLGGDGFQAIQESAAFSNIAFGGGFRPGVPQHGNLAGVTTGYDNTAIGAGVLVSATTGHSNTAVGADSLSALVTGAANTAVGAQAGENLTGSSNTAIGGNALQNATTGTNSAFGANALGVCTTGTSNTAVGLSAGATLTAANSNTAVGSIALQYPTGALNTAIGQGALQGAPAGSTAAQNTAVGASALNAVTSAANNTAVGYQALLAVTTPGGNVGVGYTAGRSIVAGYNNTFVGYQAGYTDGTNTTTDIHESVLLGENAQATTSNVIVLGKAVGTRPNLIFGGVGAAAAFGGGVGVFAIANAATVPNANPVGGGVLYVNAGALVWRGSAGTITTIAPA